MKKFWLIFGITFLIEAAITFLVTIFSSFGIREVMFFVGLIFSIFTFSGEAFGNTLNNKFSGDVGIVAKRELSEPKQSSVFMASISFLVIGLGLFIHLIVTSN